MSENSSETIRHRRGWLPFTAALLTLGLALAGCVGAGGEPDGTETDPLTSETPTAEPTASETGSTTETETGPTESADSRREVTVAVIGIEWLGAEQGIEVRSFVAEYIGDGTCSYVATNESGERVTVEVAALPDAQSTVCPARFITDVSPGTWEVVVKFSNDEVRGESEAVRVEVGA